MDCLWYLAGSIVGLALGLQFGRLLFAILAYWESTETAAKWYISIIGFVLGGGTGAIIFRRFCIEYSDAFYAVGLGIGLIISYVSPQMPCVFTLESVIRIIKMSEAMRDQLPRIEERLYLTLSTFAPPKSLSRGLKISQEELARRLERATDAFEDAQTEGEGEDEP